MKCAICNEPATRSELVIDHILPLSAGGSREPENLRLVHLRCHHKPNSKWYTLKRFIAKCFWRFIPHSHGTDNMVFIGVYRFGQYQMYECKKCGWQEAL